VPVVDDDVRDLELMIRSHHPFILVDEVEEGRVTSLLDHVANRLEMPLLRWAAHRGLARPGADAVYKTESPEQCLAHLAASNSETIAYLSDFARYFDRPEVVSRLREVHDALAGHRGAVVLSGSLADLPAHVAPLFTALRLHTPGRDVYHRYVAAVLADIKSRQSVRVDLTSEDVVELLEHLKGLPFYEVRKIITQAIVEDGCLDRKDLGAVLVAKRAAVERTGALEYIPVEAQAAEVAGLTRLRDWLDKRRRAFRDPDGARARGLTPPRGLLLTGVQGCGKSLCARAIAASWRLPLVRLDPSALYRKFFGETEQNLRRAIQTAEDVAPVVLWIDEIEKAFAGNSDNDGGTTRRVFGTFLTWLQEKKESVFVLATANDISGLPPELLRKGRFDEIFFVDLPKEDVRRTIVSLHLARRHHDPNTFDLATLAAQTEGFSGAEIEQAIVAALYSAFSAEVPLTTALLLGEIAETKPLSVTMSERVHAMRTWAENRTVPAD
jgi:hypothetical protein